MALLQRIREQLYHQVGEAVEPVADLEREWSQRKMTRRIVRYIYKAAKKEDLTKLCWSECVKKLVSSTMDTYAAECQERDWFFEINLTPAFVSAAWELSKSRQQGMSAERLDELVHMEYESVLDRILLITAMWRAANNAFSDHSVVSKVYDAVLESYDMVLDEAIVQNRPIPDHTRMRHFTKRWIHESMQCCWNSVDNADGGTITERSVTTLFANLVAPLGDDHPYSCIPNTFYPDGDRPHRNWRYIRHTVKRMFDSWARGQSAPSSKRRKKNKKK